MIGIVRSVERYGVVQNEVSDTRWDPQSVCTEPIVLMRVPIGTAHGWEIKTQIRHVVRNLDVVHAPLSSQTQPDRTRILSCDRSERLAGWIHDLFIDHGSVRIKGLASRAQLKLDTFHERLCSTGLAQKVHTTL